LVFDNWLLIFMRLSDLQKYIVLQCFNQSQNRLDRNLLLKFYGSRGKAKRELQTKVITGSIESLIDRELVLGYGLRTPHKWFIREIALTDKGKKTAKALSDKQMKLPLK